jgi:hypothetical protein
VCVLVFFLCVCCVLVVPTNQRTNQKTLLISLSIQLLVCVLVCFFVCAGGTNEPTNQPKNAVNLTIYLSVEVEHPTVPWVLSPNWHTHTDICRSDKLSYDGLQGIVILYPVFIYFISSHSTSSHLISSPVIIIIIVIIVIIVIISFISWNMEFHTKIHILYFTLHTWGWHRTLFCTVDCYYLAVYCIGGAV